MVGPLLVVAAVVGLLWYAINRFAREDAAKRREYYVEADNAWYTRAELEALGIWRD